MARGLEPTTGLLSAARLSTALHQGMIEHREGQVGSFHDEAGQKVRSHRHQTGIRPTGTKTTIVATANRFARDLMVQEIGFRSLNLCGFLPRRGTRPTHRKTSSACSHQADAWPGPVKRNRGHPPVTPQSAALCRSSGATSSRCLSPLRLRAATHVAPRDLSCELRVAQYVFSRGLCAAPDAALCQSRGPPGRAAAPGPQHLTPLTRWQVVRGSRWPTPEGKEPFDVGSLPI